MTSAYLVRLGRQADLADEAIAGGYIGVDYGVAEDLSEKFPDSWPAFNKAYIPTFLAMNPGRSKIAAGLACATLWTVGRGMSDGDLVLSPTAAGSFRIGRVAGQYHFVPGEPLPHRRAVVWLPAVVEKSAMSPDLQRATLTRGTLGNITGRLAEVEVLAGSIPTPPTVVSTDPDVEDATQFALEKYLEEFLVDNWKKTELGKEYDIYPDEDGTPIGRQYPTDTGPVDILAVSKNNKDLLVVELKRGKASDTVVGQILRYMGFVKSELAEPDQAVRGVIIALEDDQRLRRALSVIPDVEFYRYQVNFKLAKA